MVVVSFVVFHFKIPIRLRGSPMLNNPMPDLGAAFSPSSQSVQVRRQEVQFVGPILWGPILWGPMLWGPMLWGPIFGAENFRSLLRNHLAFRASARSGACCLPSCNPRRRSAWSSGQRVVLGTRGSARLGFHGCFPVEPRTRYPHQKPRCA